jgi:hypothetical protein
MLYYTYIAITQDVNVVCIYDSDCRLVGKPLITPSTTKQVNDINCKYANWIECLNIALNHLQNLIYAGTIKNTDMVRLLIPTKILYSWLAGTKPPNVYASNVEMLQFKLKDLRCNVELIATTNDSTNRALQYCNAQTEKYIRIKDF